VNAAEADRVIYLVFCERIETVLASDAEIVRYKVSPLARVGVNVAFAASVLYVCLMIETVNVAETDIVFR
jgi:hypothetical protein